MTNYKEKGKCCICGGIYTHWGNNPWPISTNEDDRCCDDCNMEVVIARLQKLNDMGSGKND